MLSCYIKTPVYRPEVDPEDLNDTTGRMISGYQIVFDPDYTQIVHRTDTISRSNSGLYLNFSVILYTENNEGKLTPINYNRGIPGYYDMYISFHANRRRVRLRSQTPPRGQHLPTRRQRIPLLQTHPNQSNVSNRIHMAMRRKNVNLPIVNTQRYHLSVTGYDANSGLIFAHRTRQDNVNVRYSRILFAIAETAYGTLKRLRNILEGNRTVPNRNYPLPKQENTEKCFSTQESWCNNNNTPRVQNIPQRVQNIPQLSSSSSKRTR